MKKVTALLALLVLALALTGCSPGGRLTNAEKIQAINTMADETLQRLYTEKPSTKDEVKKAAGYAAFSNANVNIIFASGGGGYGVVVDNATGKKTYMKMGSGGIGLGLGAKDYRQVMIFNTQDALKKFIYSGWVYSMTESGLALQATVTGTKYWKDDELN